MAQIFSKKVKYHFDSASALKIAKQMLDEKYPSLRTTQCKSSSSGFNLFVESTLSHENDSSIESLMKSCGGIMIKVV